MQICHPEYTVLKKKSINLKQSHEPATDGRVFRLEGMTVIKFKQKISNRNQSTEYFKYFVQNSKILNNGSSKSCFRSITKQHIKTV